MKYLIIIGVFLIIVILISSYENHHFEVVKRKIVIGKGPKEVETKTYSIAFISDLHSQSFGKQNVQLLQELERCSPNIVIVGGDAIIAKRTKSFEAPCQLIETMAKRYPVYYAYGNHEERSRIRNQDQKIYQEYEDRLQIAGVKILDNCKTTIWNDTIELVGLSLSMEYFQKGKSPFLTQNDIQKRIGFPDNERYTILLAHNPCYMEAYEKWGADMTLSGHVHGGMVRLPWLGGVISPQLRFFPKYSEGCHQIGKMVGVISRGLGSHTVRIRMNNRPELVLLELVQK